MDINITMYSNIIILSSQDTNKSLKFTAIIIKDFT